MLRGEVGNVSSGRRVREEAGCATVATCATAKGGAAAKPPLVFTKYSRLVRPYVGSLCAELCHRLHRSEPRGVSLDHVCDSLRRGLRRVRGSLVGAHAASGRARW